LEEKETWLLNFWSKLVFTVKFKLYWFHSMYKVIWVSFYAGIIQCLSTLNITLPPKALWPWHCPKYDAPCKGTC
jgi:hypothetical protein